ncbi:MAG: DUF1552 domain-containing protein [Armatimonadetes bacterium]|nr:DUF1552 domain-containing protein [Armatimonadota bacterium]MDE2205856.1 DUF1552 domain-containing protein [Armatimonadota bacterium]
MFLPLLEAMAPGGASAASRAVSSPVRFAALYMPNGVDPAAWTPVGSGATWQLSEILAPLSGLQRDLLVFTELMNRYSIDGDGHYAKVAPFLTGTHITKTTGSDLRCGGVSLDQELAQHLGNLTPLPSIELSIEPVTTGVDTNVGYTRLYGSHISWSSPTTPVTREIDPQQAFNRLFRSPVSEASPAREAVDSSVLDAVAHDAAALRKRIGTADRAKLDEYFEAVRAVERRIAFDAARRKGEVLDDTLARQAVQKLGTEIYSYYHDADLIRRRGIDHTGQVRLMLEIMTLAFWTDSTRIATFMFANEVSDRNFSFLPGVSGGHHQISHHGGDARKLAEYRRINTWHIEQYAWMLNRMKQIREGDGTLLDNAMVLFGGGMRDGNAHSPYNLPILLAGRAGGSLAPGRHLVYGKNTPLCDLYRGVSNRMGVPVQQFGNSDGELPGLSDAAFAGAGSA